MKNFTLLFVMLLISFGLSAKNSSDLQRKIKQNQEKISAITQLSTKLNRITSFNGSKAILKSVAATQKLDSTVNRTLNAVTQLWQNDYKDEYLYDDEMKNTEWLEKEWNIPSSDWDIISKTVLGYDASDRINSMVSYEKDESSQMLKQDSKILVFYNSLGLQDSLSMYSSEDNGVTWILDMKQVNHFNDANQLIKTDFWSLDEESGEELILSMNIVNTYTASGKINTSSVNAFFEGEEILWSQTEYNYNGSDQLISFEYSVLNFLTFAMEKSSRTTYQYNASGGRTVEISSSWNGTTWLDEDKTENLYNAAGDVSVEIESMWNGSVWVEEWKDEFTYSTTNFSEVAYPQFVFMTSIFSSFLNLFGLQESFDFSYIKAITGVKTYDMMDGNWVHTDESFIYYSDGGSTNINEFENSIVSVYPNPASESVNFSWKGNYEALSLQLFQITGSKIIEQTVYSGRPVSISHLENGVYLYKLLNGQQNVKTGKMIKR